MRADTVDTRMSQDKAPCMLRLSQCEDPAMLASLLQTSVQLLCIDRPHNSAIVHYLETAIASGNLDHGWSTELGDKDYVQLEKLTNKPGRAALLKDINHLVSLMREILPGRRKIRVRFEVTHQVTCPKFHIDSLCARLLCTYRGNGTQWLETSGLSILNPASVDFGSYAVRSIPAFSIAILKGSQWPKNEAGGVIHRSPSAMPSASPRVLLAIDIL
jgi:hypothetical protein